MELSVADTNARLTVEDSAFAQEFNEALVHQAVTACLAGARMGSKAQKTRAEVRGGGAKPWRQKGTGRARAGTIRSPLWRGGGVIFAAKPGDFSQKLNKKMYRAAMRAILSELARQERLTVVDRFAVEQPRTRELIGRLEAISVEPKDSVLIVTDSADKNLYLAARNLRAVEITEVGGLDPVSLLRVDKVIVTVAAIRQIEGWLA